MNFKVWGMNAFLLAITLFFGFRIYDTWSHGVVGPVKAQEFESTGKRDDSPVRTVARKNIPPENLYDVLVKKNLFVQERETAEEEVSAGATETEPVPTLSKEMRLYGVILMDGHKTALVSNPERRAKKDLWVRVGDPLGDFTVSQIEREKIVLEKGKKIYELPLFDKNKPERRMIVQSAEEPKVVTADKPVEKEIPKVQETEKTPDGQPVVIKTPFGNVIRKAK
jgi:hypothetical protein